MSILINENIHEIKSIYEPESENELINKNYSIVGINKRRKTACEREAIFNRLILNNPSIISIDKTLLPGTCVYCNICQVRIILNPAYYLNNWRTHMNGKLHKALSKAVGSPQFLDELDFCCLEKEEDSYFDPLNILSYNNNSSLSNLAGGTGGRREYNIMMSNGKYVTSQHMNQSLGQNENISTLNSSEGFDLFAKNPRVFSCNTIMKSRSEMVMDNSGTEGGVGQYENKVMEILDEKGDKEGSDLQGLNIEQVSDGNVASLEAGLEITNSGILGERAQIQKQDYVIHPIISSLGIEKNSQAGEEFSFILGEDLYKNALYEHNSEIVGSNSEMNATMMPAGDGVSPGEEKLLGGGGSYLHVCQDDVNGSDIIPNEEAVNLVKNLDSNTMVKYYPSVSRNDSIHEGGQQMEDRLQEDNLRQENQGKFQDTNVVSQGNSMELNNSYSSLDLPVISPLVRMNFEQIGTFYCPGINKVRYWAMCFIGSERSTEPEHDLSNYNDTRRVFYKQSVITKISPNHEPEHQGVVHHPNCLEIVPKPNEPCERCSLYINNRQLARVISKRATRLQEMWDRVVAGESIINGGKIPQSIISAYNHRIDHWSRCNDPLEAITRALAGCRQRDYTNFFWKIRENLLKNSRLIRNQL